MAASWAFRRESTAWGAPLASAVTVSTVKHIALPKEKRMIFMRRYWYLSPIAEIATDYSISESKVKMSLMRSRNELKTLLEMEGMSL